MLADLMSKQVFSSSSSRYSVTEMTIPPTTLLKISPKPHLQPVSEGRCRSIGGMTLDLFPPPTSVDPPLRSDLDRCPSRSTPTRGSQGHGHGRCLPPDDDDDDDSASLSTASASWRPQTARKVPSTEVIDIDETTTATTTAPLRFRIGRCHGNSSSDDDGDDDDGRSRRLLRGGCTTAYWRLRGSGRRRRRRRRASAAEAEHLPSTKPGCCRNVQ